MEKIKKDVAFETGHYSYEDFLKKASSGQLSELDIDEFVNAFGKSLKRPLIREIDRLENLLSENRYDLGYEY